MAFLFLRLIYENLPEHQKDPELINPETGLVYGGKTKKTTKKRKMKKRKSRKSRKRKTSKSRK